MRDRGALLPIHDFFCLALANRRRYTDTWHLTRRLLILRKSLRSRLLDVIHHRLKPRWLVLRRSLSVPGDHRFIENFSVSPSTRIDVSVAGNSSDAIARNDPLATTHTHTDLKQLATLALHLLISIRFFG